MLLFSNCKINLGLNITGKREDGYHNLATVFYPVPFHDAIEVIEDKSQTATPGANGNCQLSLSGLPIPGSQDDNLCVKAYQLLKNDFPQLPPVQMHLHKCIPMGAGLGGGSSNGAFTLRLLNEKFELGIDQDRLLSYALELGSDCPFFIINKPCYATGRGEVMEQIQLDLKGYRLILFQPGTHVSTKEAFALVRVGEPLMDAKTIVSQPVETWKDRLANDFENAVFQMQPVLASIKVALYDAGAVYASMTGSGSTIYGLFKQAPTLIPSFDGSTTITQIQL